MVNNKGTFSEFIFLIKILKSSKTEYNSLTKLARELKEFRTSTIFVNTMGKLTKRKVIIEKEFNGQSKLIEIDKTKLMQFIENHAVFIMVKEYILNPQNRWRLIQEFIDSTPVSTRGFKLTI